jgi:aerobic-type carbon monoxide dehydrogenase small subunit (CoxS/CutS family)
MDEKNTILLTLNYLGESYQIQTRRGEYHTLMTLISDHLAIPGFGLCCGMGSCGTCVVQISSSGLQVKRSVLACDVEINDALSNGQVDIPDKIY